MNAERYLEMLENYVWPKVAVWENIDDLVFVQDGVPPYFAPTLRARLDQHFPGRRLGRRGPHEWPPRSPYLTPFDFYLWGYIKEEVHKTKPRNWKTLRQEFKRLSTIFLTTSDRNSSLRLRKLVEVISAYIAL